tara:strand:- start:146 stop:352 length:207 start_codon:yes stop_codon:yes gene_type:complete
MVVPVVAQVDLTTLVVGLIRAQVSQVSVLLVALKQIVLAVAAAVREQPEPIHHQQITVVLVVMVVQVP